MREKIEWESFPKCERKSGKEKEFPSSGRNPHPRGGYRMTALSAVLKGDNKQLMAKSKPNSVSNTQNTP